MYNLMRRAAAEFDQVLVAFSGEPGQPPAEVLEICAEVVLVRRAGSHALPFTGRPEVVEEYDSPAFHAAVRQTVRKWRPALAQLEFTQLAQYAADCAPAPHHPCGARHHLRPPRATAARRGSPEICGRQTALWRRFETEAWRGVDCVVTMSERDRSLVAGARAVACRTAWIWIASAPRPRAPEPRRLLFIGSFAHLPNLMAWSSS